MAAAPSWSIKGTVYFSNFTDQQLYQVPTGGEPQHLTASSPMRFADCVMDVGRGHTAREERTIPSAKTMANEGRHLAQNDGDPINTIAAVSLVDGSQRVLVANGDFYSTEVEPRRPASGLADDGTIPICPGIGPSSGWLISMRKARSRPASCSWWH